MIEKPQYTGYKKWASENLDFNINDKKYVSYYNLITNKIKEDLEISQFWIDLKANLREFNDEYSKNQNSFPLLVNNDKQLEILIKPYNSVIQKTYRLNILNNDIFPQPPIGGWVNSGNWFSTINDIIRTQITVKYLDGVEFISNKISDFCKKEYSVCSKVDMEARQEGYYAAHINFSKDFEIPKRNWDTIHQDINIEIQVTTQIQEVIKQLLHKYYESNRMNESKNIKWQWDYKSDEFSANYLGHILHYVEGMIVEIRTKK